MSMTITTVSPSVEPSSGPRIELLDPRRGAADKAEASSHYERRQILAVEAGQPVARLIVPAANGGNGADAAPGAIPSLLGSNVRLADDGVTVLAAIAGSVRLLDGVVSVEPSLEIPGNVDFSTGNIDFAGDIHVRGNILDLFKVHGSAGIRVDGAIEAAEVVAKADLHVGAGIAGKDKGHCTAGHDLLARYVTNATIDVGNDVHVHTELSNCTVTCGGHLLVEHGPLIGGHVRANGGITCHALGSPAGVATVVEVGVDAALRQRSIADLPQIEARRKKIEQVKTSVEPLLRNSKVLNAQQKEKATELLYQANELEAETNDLVEKLRHAYEASQERCKAELVVTHLLHPGVTVRFPGMETVVQTALRGPLKLVVKPLRGVSQIVAVDQRSGSFYPLPTVHAPDPVMEQLKRTVVPTTATTPPTGHNGKAAA